MVFGPIKAFPTMCAPGKPGWKFLIDPNTIPSVKSQLGFVGTRRSAIIWRRPMDAVCPIGCLHIIADRRARTTAVADPVDAPPAEAGVRVFA